MIITITDDLDLKKITDSGQCFRAAAMKDGLFRFITGNHVLYIQKTNETQYDVSCSQKEWDTVWFDYFDLSRNYAAIRKSVKKDPYLSKVSDEGKGIRILRQDHFEMLVSFIISQRKSIPSIRACIENLCAKYGTPIQTPHETIYTFPSPEQLMAATMDDYNLCKLGYRSPYVLDAVHKTASGQLNLDAIESLPDEELLNILMTVNGVGIKVSNCVCLFSYGRTSLAPVDTWIQKVIDKEYGGINPFPSFGKHAGILQQYIFYYTLQHKEAYR